MKVLLIMEQCNPGWASVPLVAYNFYKEISKRAEVTLVTHERNKPNLSKVSNTSIIYYIHESRSTKIYYKITGKILSKTGNSWALSQALRYPIYNEFNSKVFKIFSDQVSNNQYDIVHAMTPIIPRYPYKIIESCHHVPFLLGPVNGGLPYPPGFKDIEKKELSCLNFLRSFGRSIIPGYIKTYTTSDMILSGSQHTLSIIKSITGVDNKKLQLLPENGVDMEFFHKKDKKQEGTSIRLLFVGRLVPYKGADMLIDSIAKLDQSIINRLHLTIVGDGQEKDALQKKAIALGLEDKVEFSGWINHESIINKYRDADLFCFPSIREFGGAVVLEAMACSLPCIIVDHGGIGEYVTTNCGYKIKPLSKDHIVNELQRYITILSNDYNLLHKMSRHAYERASKYQWSKKADDVLEIYSKLINYKNQCSKQS